MTYPEDFTVPAELLEQIREQGLEILPELIRTILNAAMQAERKQHMQAEPYQRTPQRAAQANGYKPKTMTTRVGKITFSVPQVREGGFYPQALEKGLRSERALVLAMAEMYVQGVSTRKVKAITEQLCGVEVSAAQVSRAAGQLDAELEKWRSRPLGPIAFGDRAELLSVMMDASTSPIPEIKGSLYSITRASFCRNLEQRGMDSWTNRWALHWGRTAGSTWPILGMLG